MPVPTSRAARRRRARFAEHLAAKIAPRIFDFTGDRIERVVAAPAITALRAAIAMHFKQGASVVVPLPEKTARAFSDDYDGEMAQGMTPYLAVGSDDAGAICYIHRALRVAHHDPAVRRQHEIAVMEALIEHECAFTGDPLVRNRQIRSHGGYP
jgi:hypothetical protein